MTMSSQRASFTSLSNELIAQIFELSHVSDHFNLVSEYLPLTIPSVLQKVVRDPYVAWNIRSIEIWGDRPSWRCWGAFRLEEPENRVYNRLEWPPYFESPTVEDCIPSDEDLELYLNLLKEHAHLPPMEVEDVRESHFLGGTDCYYKLLLILLCPRLRSLKNLRPEDKGYNCDEARYVSQSFASMAKELGIF
jgi:hypothetical protein